MRKAERNAIVDYQTYEDKRDAARQAIFEVKRPRRIHLGDYLTFLFENADTVLYQVQEMMRAEKIVRDRDIQHELDTYNELLGGPGEIGCTLLIEIDDPAERDVKLVAWMGLVEQIYLRVDDGKVVHPTFDARQVGEDRLSAVQYIKFDTGGRNPVAVGCCHPDPDVGIEVALTPEQADALATDLHS